MQRESVPVAAEGIGQDDVGTRFDEPAVQLLDPLGVLDVPEFGRVARRESHLEVVGPRGTVGEQHPTGGEQIGKGRGHHRGRYRTTEGATVPIAFEEDLWPTTCCTNCFPSRGRQR